MVSVIEHECIVYVCECEWDVAPCRGLREYLTFVTPEIIEFTLTHNYTYTHRSLQKVDKSLCVYVYTYINKCMYAVLYVSGSVRL